MFSDLANKIKNGQQTEALLATMLGNAFSIPPDATIRGITVTIETRDLELFASEDDLISILKGGSPTGIDQSNAVPWSVSPAIKIWGSATHLWGTTWTVAEINDPGFGVSIKGVKTPNDFSRPSIDYVQITINYSRPNQAPVLAAIGAQSVDEGNNLNFLAIGTDPDGPSPIMTSTTLPVGASFIDNGTGTGTFDWTPGPGDAGNYSVTFYASDSLATDSEVVTITVSVHSSQTRFVGTAASNAPGVQAWLNPTNVTADDGVFSDLANKIKNGQSTETLEATMLGNAFNLPSNAIIRGITVTIEARNLDIFALEDNVISILKDGSPTGTDQSDAVPWPVTLATKTWGSPTHIWGTTWTVAEINAPGFGVSIQGVKTPNDFSWPSIDYIQITVDYSSLNQAPVLAAIGAQAVDEGANLNFVVTGTDPDGPPPTLTSSTLPSGASFLDSGNGAGTFDWTPGAGDAGIYSVTFYASDGLSTDSEVVAITVSVAGSAGTQYYVSPTGNDGNDGRSPSTAWRSIDNGDLLKTAVLLSGDTINIMPGTYSETESVELSTSGVAGYPIVYRRIGRAPATLSLNNVTKQAIIITGGYVEVHGLTITNVNEDGILAYGNYGVIAGCRILGVARRGIEVKGNYCLFYRNLIHQAGQDGIRIEDAGQNGNLIYHNTIHESAGHGIELQGSVKGVRIFNNIVTKGSDRGITGDVANICAFNNVWGNAAGDYVAVVDSAGGISATPRFVDDRSGRFDLMRDDAGIDMGTDIGFGFNGSAPDMGAIEKYNVYYVRSAGDDSADGRSTITAWRSIDNGDSILLPGDTVYVAAGTYVDSVVVTDSGASNNDRIVFWGVRDSTLVEASGASLGVDLQGEAIEWNGISVAGAAVTNLYVRHKWVRITRSRFTSAGMYGIHAMARCVLSQNVFASNGTTGVFMSGADVADVLNSTFFENGWYGFYGSSSGNLLVNNIFQGHDSAGVWGNASTDITYSDFYANRFATMGGAALGFGSILNDPLMVEPGSGDVRLGSASPAIDAGIDVGLLYDGAAPDMGAYETSNNLASLTVVPSYDSLFADSTYGFDVIGLDTLGNPTSPGVLTWSHTFASGTIDSDGLFTPQFIGSGEIVATSSIGGITDTSIEFSVVPGALATLTVSPDRDTVSADTTRTFTVSGTDSKGNSVSSVGTITWDVVGSMGTINSSGLFDATLAGVGFVSATSSLGPYDLSDSLFVVPGTISYIDVIPDSLAIIEFTAQQYSAKSYDGDGNLIGDVTGSAAWTTTDTSGNVSAGGMYTASGDVSPPSYYVTAVLAGSYSDSGQVSIVSSGLLDHVKVERLDGTLFGDTLLTTDHDTTRIYCRGYTSSDSLLGDVTATWSFVGPDTVGMFSDTTGTLTTLTLTKPGSTLIAAFVAGGITDTTGIIVVQAGEPAVLTISPGSLTLSADSIKNFTTVSKDADGNLSDPLVAATWMVLGGVGSIDGSGLFTPSVAGTGSVVASGAGLTDTAFPVIVVPGNLTRMEVQPDSIVVSADSVKAFSAQGFDSHGNATSSGLIAWSLTAALGTIDSTGLFDPTTTGVGAVVAQSDLGPADTSTYLSVIAGRLKSLAVSPDSATVTTDSTLAYSATGADADGNVTGTGSLSWTVTNGVGSIDGSGIFDPQTVGSGQVVVTSSIDGVSDTTTAVVVWPGVLDRISVIPDTATVIVGDRVAFGAVGYDADFNITATGTLSWSVVGPIGSVDTTGKFSATGAGVGAVAVLSSLGGVTDTSGAVIVEALVITAIPLGLSTVTPGQSQPVLLAFELANPYATDKSVQNIVVRDVNRGTDTPLESAANIDSLILYLDLDFDYTVSVADILLASASVDSQSTSLSFTPFTVAAGQTRRILVSSQISLYAHDGDTLDLELDPGQDISTLDGTTIEGPNPINSFGLNIVDGMVAAQIGLVATGNDSITAAAGLRRVFTLDIPRNGHAPDTLIAFSLANAGTAPERDFDSLVLFADDGNGTWGGVGEEARLGMLVYTGARWSVSGLRLPLTSLLTRLYVGATLIEFPTNAATFVPEIPLWGLEMVSANDGPLDKAARSGDTIVVVSPEILILSALQIEPYDLAPGDASGPIWACEMINAALMPITLDSLRFTLLLDDPNGGASQAELDSQIDSIQLYLDLDGDIENLSVSDSLLSTSTVAGGLTVLSGGGLTIPSIGGRVSLFSRIFVSSDRAKDANLINISINDSIDVFFPQAVGITGSFPVVNAEDFEIDAFRSAAISETPVPAGTFFGNQTGRVAFGFHLPPNGYSIDSLRSIRLRNNGTLGGEDSLLTINLWCDLTGDGLTPDDTLLGLLASIGPFWEASGLDVAIGPLGLQLLVTVDIADIQFSGGTLKLEIPGDGVEYNSGLVGPDDGTVTATVTHLVLPPNRLTAVSVPGTSRSVNPGDLDQPIFSFALYNGYVAQTQILQSVRLTNISKTTSSSVFSDAELGQIALYLDADNNRTLSNDSLIATGLFTGSNLQLTGLNVQLAPESLSYFFVVADQLPLSMIDSDSLAVSILNPADFGFVNSDVIINGDMPLAGGSYLIVDGSVRDQYVLLDLLPRTLSPGESNVTLMAFQPAANGDQSDFLEVLTITNAQNADTSDLTGMELWLDLDGDSLWSATDSLLGALSYNGGAWSIGALNLPVGLSPPSLFVLADVSPLATLDAVFEGVIPVGGCQYASGNDGPVDSALSQIPFSISNTGLRIAYTPLASTYSVGQTITLISTVTNVLATTIDTVVGSVVYLDNPGLLSLDSVTVGPASLVAGESTDFLWHYTALATGTVYWRLRADAPDVPDSSAVIQTSAVTIQSSPSTVSVTLLNSIPAAVTKGQANVFPLTITYAHPNLVSTYASLHLDSLQIQVEDGAGNPLLANQVLSRMVLSSGSQTAATVSSMPASSTVWLVFGEPEIVSPGESVSYSLLVDIDSSATAPLFNLALGSTAALPLVDANAQLPITLDPGLVFPMRTASCRIDEASQEMAVSSQGLASIVTNYGQQGASMMRLYLRHPGASGSSQIQLTNLKFECLDNLGVPIVLSQVFTQLLLVADNVVIGAISLNDLDTTLASIDLNLPITLSPSQQDSIEIRATIDSLSTVPGFRLSIADSSHFVIRDLSSGSPLVASTDTMLSTGVVFPMTSGWTTLFQPALATEYCLSGVNPTTTLAGANNVALVDISLVQPADLAYSSVRLRGVKLEPQDSLGVTLDPQDLFDRVGISINGAPTEYQTFVEVQGTAVLFSFTDTGLVMAPTDSVNVRLVADLEADVPFNHFRVRISGVSEFDMIDATDTTQTLVPVAAGGCSGQAPFVSATTQIILPAGQPVLTWPGEPVVLSYPGDPSVSLLDVAVAYSSPTPLADILLHVLSGRLFARTPVGLSPVAVGAVFARVEARFDAVLLAVDSTLATDRVSLVLPLPYTMSNGMVGNLQITAELVSSVAQGNYILEFSDSTFMDLTDANRAVPVYPFVPGESYPLLSREFSVTAVGLESSFTNYPNPFRPSRGEATTIGFNLSSDARVDVEIFSITGQSVKVIARDAERSAGMNQSDIWYGFNEHGLNVASGTYYCRITARYASGEEETTRRKIVVVR